MANTYEYPYESPEFLLGQSADEIHRRMLDSLPPGIDKSEGGIAWDFTRPAALEKAEMAEFTLNETIKLMFPQWAYGKWLDLHGEKVNCIRRAANRASGTLTVTGTPGTEIPVGYQFATPSGLTASVLFETVESVVLEGVPDSREQVTCDAAVRALDGGLTGNVPEDTIKLMVKPISGIAYVTNNAPITGGTEEETDNEYRIRILDAMRSGASMTGCAADYIRWGKEVPAVGQVIVDSEWPDPSMPNRFHYIDSHGREKCAGAVRLIIVDSNGRPANQQILDAVYHHIAGNGADDIERLMPIGAHLTVAAPQGLTVNIEADVLPADGEDIAVITERFKKNISAYWLSVGQEAVGDRLQHTGYIRWVQVGAVLAKTPGVKDYAALAVNGGTANIPMQHIQYPITGEVILRVKS